MGEILYIKLNRNTETTKAEVYLKDMASLFCVNPHTLAKAKALKIYQFREAESKREVISILKVIEILHKTDEKLQIVSVGETDTVLELVNKEKHKKVVQAIKIISVSLISFFGTSFTIMSYHNDIGIHELFLKIHTLVMGYESNGYSLLEFSYSIGLAVGIIVFFNHIGGKRLSKDPTPVEVKMRIYEDDVNSALVEMAGREGKEIDVS